MNVHFQISDISIHVLYVCLENERYELAKSYPDILSLLIHELGKNKWCRLQDDFEVPPK
jgi:hypothetical protein